MALGPVRSSFAAALFTACLAAPLAASAEEPSAEVVPMLQSSVPDLAGGWNGVVVRLRAPADRALEGRVHVVCSGYASGDREESVVTAPFAVPAGTSVALRVPFFVREFEQVSIEVEDQSGKSLQSAALNGRAQGEVALLLDVSPASRFSEGVNGKSATRLLGSGAGGRDVLGRLARPPFDYGSGDPILPDRAALYGGVSVVLLRSDVLARLRGPELDALAGFVLSGGTLAVVVTRPDDLRGEVLTGFVGGAAALGPAPGLAMEPTLPAEDPAQRSGASSGSSGTSWGPAGSAGSAVARIEPSAAVRADLRGYSGGNLAPSRFGATATYGLGEVHLLAFDTTQASVAGDPYVHARLTQLLGRAWRLRGGAVTSVHGPAQPRDVLRTLDPNEGSTGAVLLSALLLVVYAVLVGPVNFFAARRAGKPVVAFVRLPVLAAVAFLVIVVVGVASKGVRGRALHLSFVEAGAGMDVGAARRYRGFYLARASDLTVRAAPGALAATLRIGFGRGKDEKLLVDRDGARLVDVQARPWQVVAIREEGVAKLGGGVAMLPDGAGFKLVNHTGKRLLAVLVRLPRPHASSEAWYFPRVEAGGAVGPADGEPADPGWSASTDAKLHVDGRELRQLGAQHLGWMDRKHKGLRDAWEALEEDVRGGDWFPGDVPVVLAEVEGGEGAGADAGLPVERDRLLVRVVGWGGAP